MQVLPVRGTLPASMDQAMRSERNNFEQWVRETRGPLDPFNMGGW